MKKDIILIINYGTHTNICITLKIKSRRSGFSKSSLLESIILMITGVLPMATDGNTAKIPSEFRIFSNTNEKLAFSPYRGGEKRARNK